VLLAVHPGSIRQAGGREAVFQALVAKNYGCTHFIVYRDPASPFESQDMFGQYDSKDLGITTLFFDPAFFCKGCGGMATSKTCPHTDVARVLFTDAGVRDLLQKGKPLPLEYVRAEIGVVLLDAVKSKKSANLDI
jgi:sulfate adenylyltransferase